MWATRPYHRWTFLPVCWACFWEIMKPSDFWGVLISMTLFSEPSDTKLNINTTCYENITTNGIHATSAAHFWEGSRLKRCDFWKCSAPWEVYLALRCFKRVLEMAQSGWTIEGWSCKTSTVKLSWRRQRGNLHTRGWVAAETHMRPARCLLMNTTYTEHGRAAAKVKWGAHCVKPFQMILE